MAVTALTLAVSAVGVASQARSAKKATAAQTAGVDAGIEEQRRQAEQSRADLSGSRERGNLAGERQAELLGLRGVEAEEAALQRFTESPGQAFLRERGARQANRAASVGGGLGGGNVLEELNRQGIGFAGQFLGEHQDRLGDLAGQGLSATGQQVAAGAGSSANISNLLGQRGAIQGAGINAVNQARRSGLAQVAGAFTGSGAPSFGAASPAASGGGAFGLTKKFINPLTGR